MAKHDVVTTDAEVNQAIERASLLCDEPRVQTVVYRSEPGLDLFILELTNGRRAIFPRECLQGLQVGTVEQLSDIVILGKGTGLHWPAFHVALYVPELLQGNYGSRDWMDFLAQGTHGAYQKAS